MIPLRLFLAFWPNASIRRQIEQTREMFHNVKARWIHPENLHVTLVFLGDTAPDRLPSIVASLSGVQIGGFDLTLDFALIHYRSRMLWLTPTEKPPALIALARLLMERLQGLGFKPDSRRYSPHVTLARKIQGKPACRAIAPIQWSIDCFSLIDSKPGENGSIYTIVENWSLARLP